MSVFRNKITGVCIEIPSEFGNSEVWEKLSPAPAAEKPEKAEPVKKDVKAKTATAPKKATTTKKAVKK